MCDLLILAHMWFTPGFAFKTGCDSTWSRVPGGRDKHKEKGISGDRPRYNLDEDSKPYMIETLSLVTVYKYVPPAWGIGKDNLAIA